MEIPDIQVGDIIMKHYAHPYCTVVGKVIETRLKGISGSYMVEVRVLIAFYTIPVGATWSISISTATDVKVLVKGKVKE